MCTRTGRRSTNALARNAPVKPTIPISRPNATTWAVMTPAYPNTDSRTTPTTIEITASVAITAAPCNPADIRMDSRITPAPTVPPITAP